MADHNEPGEDQGTPVPPAGEPEPALAAPSPIIEPAAPPPPPEPAPFVRAPAPRRRRRDSLIGRLIIGLLILVLVLPPAWVGVYRFAPPPVTPLMLIRLGQGQGLDYQWRPLSQISPALVQAAVAAEDSGFCQHNGFDLKAMQKAMANNERRPHRVRGGSTISQQTAKNVFLWPDRSYVRKAVEAYFTVLIEALWGKRRIMEVYLNVVEMGPGIYGANAAAHRYFGVDAAHLSNLQASRLAAILPNPLKWKAATPGRYVQTRSRRIGGAIGTVRTDGLAACVGQLSGYVPASPPDLNARPPKAAEAFVQQQAREAEPTAPASPASDAAGPLDALPVDPSPGAASDTLQTPAAPETSTAPADQPAQ